MNPDATAPILPGDDTEEQRRRENLLRRRLLSGHWLDELTTRIAEHFDEARQRVMGRPTLSRNLARTVIRQLAVLYDQAPVERNETQSDANEQLLDLAHKAGVWEMGTRLQQRVLLVREGMREIATVGPEGGQRLLYRHVHLDRVWAESSSDDPDQPRRLIQARRRTIEGNVMWTWDAWDINPDAPRFAVLKPKTIQAGADPFQAADDLTDHPDVFDSGARFEGDAFRWRYADGEPFMPLVLYHAERTGDLFDSFEGIEMVDGTLDVATLWTFWLHCVKDAAWPQRYVLNAILRGESIDGAEGFEKFAKVAAVPSAIMQFFSSEMQAAVFGQWMPGADPNGLELAISSFERATAAQFNLSPSDFQASGSAESGYALSIKRQAVREAQRRFEPQFRRGDTELMRKTAAMANAAGIVSGASEDGWNFTYPALPMSPEERAAAKEKIESYSALGLQASKVWQVQQLEQVDRDNAMEIIVQWAKDEAELGERLAAEGAEAQPDLTPDEIASMRAMMAAQRAPLPATMQNQGAQPEQEQ